MNCLDLVLLVESIPEAFMLISLGLALYGYDIREKLPNIIFAAVFYALITFITRNMIDFYHTRTIINVLLLFIVMLAMKIEPLRALFASFTSMLSLLLAETILVIIVTWIIQQPMEQILTNRWMQIFLPFPHIILLIFLAFYLAKKNYSLLKLGSKLTDQFQTRKSGAMYLAVLFLFLAVILAIINVGIISGENTLGKFVQGRGIYVLTGLIALDIYLMFGVVGRLFKISEQQSLIQTQEIYLKSLEEIMETLRAQRHDFINHLEVIHSLHSQKNYCEVEKYLNKLLGEISQVNSIVHIDNPPLGALLNAKRLAAEGKGITMEIEVSTPLRDLPMDTYVLVKILGNIIDNAIDALQDSKEKLIEVEIEKYLNSYVITVLNTGPVITEENLAQIFKRGFTTKSNGHQGIGLTTSKEIVETYGGEIKVKSTPEKGTIFTIILPAKHRA